MKKLNLMLSCFSSVTLCALLALGAVAPAFAAPPNDNFASAQVITTAQGTANGSNVDATKEAGEPDQDGTDFTTPHAGGYTVWYRWAPGKGNARFKINANFGVYTTVFTGNSINALQSVIHNYGASPEVRWRAEAATTYYIAMDSRVFITNPPTPDETGAFTVNWNVYASPANDDFANASVITGNNGTIAGNNLGAYFEANEPTHHEQYSSMWYRWTAPANGSVVFDTENSAFDTVLGAYSGATATQASDVNNWKGSDNDGGTGTLSKVPFTVVGGTAYSIAVCGSKVGQTDNFTGPRGAFSLNWAFTPAPANDNFANAQNLLPVNGGTVQGTNVGAGKETGERSHNSQIHSESIWYKITPPGNGVLTIDTAGTPFDTFLAVYSSNALPTTFTVRAAESSDDAALNPATASRVKFDALSGVTYQILVDSDTGAQPNESSTGYYVTHGPVTLNWNFTPAPANDLFANGQVIQGAAGQVAGTLLGANTETSEQDHNSMSLNSTIWYRWTAPFSGDVTFDTFDSSRPAGFVVYTGTALNNLVKCTNINGGFVNGYGNNASGEDTLPVQGGTTYHIAIDACTIYGSSSIVTVPTYDLVHGDPILRWSLNNTPIPARTPPTITGFTPTTGPAGTVVTINGTNFNGTLEVRLNGTPATFTVVSNTKITATVPANTLTGKISVHTPQGIVTTTANFVVAQAPTGPANDNFANAINVNAATMTGTNVDATKQTGEPNHAASAGGKSVWWKWTAPANGTVTFDTAGSTFDTLLGFYTGASVGALTERAQNDDATGVATSRISNVAVTGGVTYYIAVDGYTGLSGNVTLNYSFTATPTGTPGALRFSGASYSVNEGAGTATITVTRTGGSDGAVGVTYATANGTATAGSDYTTKTGTLSFAAGVTSQTFTIAITNDTLDEADETINLTLSSATGGATLGTPATAQVTVVDNDNAPGGCSNLFTDSDLEATAPNPTWTIQTSTNFGTPLYNGAADAAAAPQSGVTWAWFGGTDQPEVATLGRSATLPVGANVTLSFGLWMVVKSPFTDVLRVKVDGTTVATYNEPGVSESTYSTRTINLSAYADGAAHSIIFEYVGVGGTGNNANFNVDDIELEVCATAAAPTLAVNNPRSLREGNAGASGSVTFDITLSAASTQSVTVNYQTANGTNNPAIAGSDYTAKTGKLTFAPGETLKRVTISFIGDSAVELNETFFFDLKTPTNATIADNRGVGQINNDDGPGITIGNAVTLDEGSSGTKSQTFMVTLSAASTNTVTVDWTTANNTATTADYVTASGTLSFAPGETSKLINVLVKGDTTVEPNETYKVVLSKVAYAFITDGLGIGTIRNDDAAPLLFENDEPSQ